MKLNCLEDLRIKVFLSGAKYGLDCVFSLYRKPQEGSLAACGEEGSSQGAEGNEARDDGSLQMAREIKIASLKHLISSPFS